MRKSSLEKYNKKLHDEFLPEALEIIEKPASPMGHFMLWLLIIIILAVILWASIGKIDVNVSSTGTVVSTNGVQLVQAAGSGIVGEVRICDGKHVEKGDILYQIDDSVDETQLTVFSKGNRTLQLKIAMLEDYMEGKDLSTYSENASEEEIATVNYIMTFLKCQESSMETAKTNQESASGEYDMEKERLQIYEEKAKVLKSRKKELEALYKGEGAESIKLKNLQAEAETLKSTVKDYKILYDADTITKTEYKAKQAEYKELLGDIKVQKKIAEKEITEQKNNITDAVNQISENQIEVDLQKKQVQLANTKVKNAKAEYTQAENEVKQQIQAMIEECQKELDSNLINIESSKKEMEYKQVTAFCSGTVNVVNVKHKGEVVEESQVLAEITPDYNQIIMEAEVQNRDIGYIALNQDVSIKLDTYDYQKYGKWNGKVVYIGSDSVLNENGMRVFKVKVSVDANKVSKDIIPEVGMTGVVEIKTDERRIIEFLLEPLFDKLDTGLKVR